MSRAELPACQDRPRHNRAKMGDRDVDVVGQDLGHSNTALKMSKCEAGTIVSQVPAQHQTQNALYPTPVSS